MKYTNLVGKSLETQGLKYLYSVWTENSNLQKYQGQSPKLIDSHRICDKEGELFGLECVYLKQYEGEYFIFPVSELERTNQISSKDLILTTYEIY